MTGLKRIVIAAVVVVALAVPGAAVAATGGASPPSGSSGSGQSSGGTPAAAPAPAGPKATAQIAANGRIATAPVGAPAGVKLAIAAANRLVRKPYVWGGGHRGFKSRGYDCSGSVSYVLHAVGVLDAPLVSGALAHWGQAGSGAWITVFANRGHAFMTIAGLRFDTAGAGESGPRWRVDAQESGRFAQRHPVGL